MFPPPQIIGGGHPHPWPPALFLRLCGTCIIQIRGRSLSGREYSRRLSGKPKAGWSTCLFLDNTLQKVSGTRRSGT